jgi:hypothetical protein
MTTQELQVSLEQLEKDYEEKRKNAIRDYALSNNPYKIGDVIEDHICKIKITKILVSIYSKCCVYEGIKLKKDGTPFKNNALDKISQGNILNNSPKH